VTGLPASGVIPVAKPEGPTSRRVVDAVVRRLRVKRTGHAGTLDPFAEGLLLVAFGRATGLVPYLQAYPKTYEVEAEFGRVTDTQDRTGETVAVADPSGLTRTAVEEALPRFRGQVRQVPPMFSAVRSGGKRLHELARRGEEVVREPRVRRVDAFELLAWEPPRASFRVVCEGGTYVRTLVHDLGESVGPGAHAVRLTRTAIGPHRLADALDAGGLEGIDDADLAARVLTPAAALPDLPAISVVDAAERRAVVLGSWTDPGERLPRDVPTRILDDDGVLLALARREDRARLLRVFVAPEDA
jgi:tRNA pseudouridine55 synthase